MKGGRFQMKSPTFIGDCCLGSVGQKSVKVMVLIK